MAELSTMNEPSGLEPRMLLLASCAVRTLGDDADEPGFKKLGRTRMEYVVVAPLVFPATSPALAVTKVSPTFSGVRVRFQSPFPFAVTVPRLRDPEVSVTV